MYINDLLTSKAVSRTRGSTQELTAEYKEEIAMLLNPTGPLNAELNASVQIEAICFVDIVPAGEHAYVYADFDTDSDVIYLYDTANDTLTHIKKNPIEDTEISFSAINSNFEWVALQKVINTPDLKIFQRKRNRIIAGMDKYELYYVIQAIKNGTNKPSSIGMNTTTVVSGEDLYDVIRNSYNEIRTYGTEYVMLAGTDVVNKIDAWSKDYATTNNYDVSLEKFLMNKRIEVIEVAEQLQTTSDGSSARILDTDEYILVAKKSNLDGGKPIVFARREIPSNVASESGVEVDSRQRIIFINGVPQYINFSGVTSATLGYGVFGFGEIAIAIHNPKSIVSATGLSALLV